MPEIWDLEDEENQRKEPLCTLLKQNPGPHFKRVFRNSVYDVLKINTSWFYHLWHIDDLNAIDLFIEILPNSGCVSALAHAFMYISKQERMSVQNKQCVVIMILIMIWFFFLSLLIRTKQTSVTPLPLFALLFLGLTWTWSR